MEIHVHICVIYAAISIVYIFTIFKHNFWDKKKSI